ncbi:glutaredoxin family protein [Viridibacterium curvum]|uniref:DUF4124 domain-containing protein n=1 Tax=Viridibacterium curvum TaxID=1101404 RepID=A0ABP9QTP8_9RHOO
MKALLALLTCLMVAQTAVAQVYRWVDKDGKVHYGDQPPPELKSEKPNLPSNSVGQQEGSYEANKAAQAAPVTLYTAPDCKDLCDKARALLKKRKVPFSEKSVTSKEQLAQLGKLTGSKEPQAPSVTIGSKAIEGFSEGGWNGALDTAGYPKAP